MIRFMVCYAYFASELVLKDYAEDIYLNGVVLGVAETIGAVICFVAAEGWSCRKAVWISAFISAGVSFAVFGLVPCEGEQSCSSLEKGMQTVGILVGRLLITVAYCYLVVWLTELYPSQIRGIGVQFNCLANNLSFMVIPPLQSFFERTQQSITVTFGVACLLAGLLSLCLKETSGESPAEII